MATTTTTSEPAALEGGWQPDTPDGDSVLRASVQNQADLNDLFARAHGGPSRRTGSVALAATHAPVPYLNQAVLLRPIHDADDPTLDEIEAFFADAGVPHTLLSLWPTPDLSRRGWNLYGHPMFCVRPPAPVPAFRPAAVETGVAGTLGGLAAAERVMAEGYPMPPMIGAPEGSVLPPALLGSALTVRLGFLDGHPVAAASSHIARGVVNLCMAATLPAARRQGVWARLVWDRVADAPDLPAVAFTSDLSRPGFVNLSFLPVLRTTLWGR